MLEREVILKTQRYLFSTSEPYWKLKVQIKKFNECHIKFQSYIIQTCLDVADLRCLRAEACWLAGDGEQGGDAQGDPAEHHGHGGDGGCWQHWPAGHVLHVHPEADPGHDHDEDGGDVALDQVEADTAVQLELGRQAAVVTWQSIGK